MKRFLYRVLCGFFLGLSVVAPGVSGSVIAVIMGIYDRLVSIMAHPLKDFKRNVLYLLPMGIGAVLSLVMFVLVFSYLFDTYPTVTSMLFIGLIAGNMPFVYRQTKGGRVKKHYLVAAGIAFALALGCGILGMQLSSTSGATTPGLLHIIFSGVLAGVAGLVPGMSVSMILMMLGTYAYLIDAALSFNILELAAFGVALLAALILFSRVIKIVLHRYHYFAYYMIMGFMCGSLLSICLELPARDANFHWPVGILALLAGLGISLAFAVFGRKFADDDAMEGKPKRVLK